MSHVITANYRDRKSPTPWLVREEGKPPEDAVPVAALKATGVRFVNAAKTGDDASGCSVAAIAQSLEIIDVPAVALLNESNPESVVLPPVLYVKKGDLVTLSGYVTTDPDPESFYVEFSSGDGAWVTKSAIAKVETPENDGKPEKLTYSWGSFKVRGQSLSDAKEMTLGPDKKMSAVL